MALDSTSGLEPEPDWPLLTTPVSAGAPIPAAEGIERFLRLDTHLVRHPERTFLVRVASAALADAGLHDGICWSWMESCRRWRAVWRWQSWREYPSSPA